MSLMGDKDLRGLKILVDGEDTGLNVLPSKKDIKEEYKESKKIASLLGQRIVIDIEVDNGNINFLTRGARSVPWKITKRTKKQQ